MKIRFYLFFIYLSSFFLNYIPFHLKLNSGHHFFKVAMKLVNITLKINISKFWLSIFCYLILISQILSYHLPSFISLAINSMIIAHFRGNYFSGLQNMSIFVGLYLQIIEIPGKFRLLSYSVILDRLIYFLISKKLVKFL